MNPVDFCRRTMLYLGVRANAVILKEIRFRKVNLFRDCLFRTGLHTAWLTAAVYAEITFDNTAFSWAVWFQYTKWAVHHTHKAAGAASFIIFHNTGPGYVGGLQRAHKPFKVEFRAF